MLALFYKLLLLSVFLLIFSSVLLLSDRFKSAFKELGLLVLLLFMMFYGILAMEMVQIYDKVHVLLDVILLFFLEMGLVLFQVQLAFQEFIK